MICYYSAMGGSGAYTDSASQNSFMIAQMNLHGYAGGSCGVNDPEQFTDKLAAALASDRRIGKILVDKTIGLALGKNSLTARSR